ncbi:inositol-trisphosphate 3-kinase homolog isoform X4 [Halyomorpha halys]|uniref:inositol-trisphosphate 3-kinase homolog isoform X4 n=1 Tax=Halyomorpha halys TaxID=286706 RepID=UPI0006D51B1F
MDINSNSGFPPQSYSTAFNLRNEIKQYLMSKGLSKLKNGVLKVNSNSNKGAASKESWRSGCCVTGKRQCRKQHEDSSLLKFLALNALELSAPASDALLRSQQMQGSNQAWFQLSGHPDAFAPAGPGTIWKKCSGGDEKAVYEALAGEPELRGITPAYLRHVNYGSQSFIELQDLLYGFRDPNVMDVKLGTRTFLESEVENTVARHDLYLKMVGVDPDAPTEEEHNSQAVTKMRYMQFREQQSSTCSLGFRIEAMKFRGSPPVTDLKRVKSDEDVIDTMSLFLGGRGDVRQRLLARLTEIKNVLDQSVYFKKHEVVGSSILILYDDTKVGAWLIDFAKTREVPEDITLNHRVQWEPGNHEEGFLFGLDNLIKVLGKVPSKSTPPNVTPTKPLALKS